MSVPAQGSVVVGVDGSERNLAAVWWALEQACVQRSGLVLVGVATPEGVNHLPWSPDTTLQYSEQETARLLQRVACRLTDRVASLTTDLRLETEIRFGDPARELLSSAAPTDVIVVGRRGIGLVERVVLGSTSLALAGRASGPVVIVPDAWDTNDVDRGPVVAGVDGTERDDGVLDFAFRRAEEHAVALVVVSSSEVPAVYAWEAAELEQWTKDAETRLEDRIASWRSRFPTVHATCQAPPASASAALLGLSAEARLLVLGRYAGQHRLDGFSGFSTLRRVLHRAVCPVAVVPVTAVAPESFRFDDTDVPQF